MIINRLKKYLELLKQNSEGVNKIQEALGRIEARQLHGRFQGDIRSVEFRAFSQWGEDGIIQELIRLVNPQAKKFIEFGVQNYRESNTRFLLINNNWSGLIIDGSEKNINYIKKDPIYWQHNLKADCAFITIENINDIFLRNGFSGEVGLLSIDIDGNDYWVWNAINVVSPAIVITEYNARYGSEKAVTVPYDPAFVRENAHFSGIYYGASLKAMCQLANHKGYTFIGCNSAGNNAFFVKNEFMSPPLRAYSCEEGYVRNQFREARDKDGRLIFLNKDEESLLLWSLPYIDVGTIEDGKRKAD